MFFWSKPPIYKEDSDKIFLEFYGEKFSNQLITYARFDGWNLLENRGLNKF